MNSTERNAAKIKALEEEIEKMETGANPPEDDQEDKQDEKVQPKKPEEPKEPSDENLSPEEITYKKRYGDLRSFSAKRENELKEKLAEAEKKLNKKAPALPKTPEEVNEWKDKYPDVYDLIVTIAKQNALEVNSDVDKRLNEINEREHNYAKQVAYNQLLDAHPDFPEIAPSEEFIAWVEAQPTYIYNALYENETDARAAIRAIDLYKADKNKGKPKKKDDAREAAQSTPKGAGASNPGTGNEPEFTESRIAKMTWREQEANMEAIEKAMLNPAFFDLSGAAR